jgi:predicted transcriptional regulator
MPNTRERQLLASHLRHPPPAARDAVADVLLSIKPHYAELIERGEKRVEFRRRFPREVGRARAIFYLTAPVRAIGLVATIARVVRGAPGELWREFAATAGTRRDAFDAYFAGAADGVALVLESVRVIAPSIAMGDPRLHGLRPPQSLAVLPPRSVIARLI